MKFEIDLSWSGLAKTAKTLGSKTVTGVKNHATPITIFGALGVAAGLAGNALKARDAEKAKKEEETIAAAEEPPVADPADVDAAWAKAAGFDKPEDSDA